MTAPPFAGVPTLRDAEPALPPPAQVTATSAPSDPPPLGRGAFYSTRKLCPHCRHVFFRPMKQAIHKWEAQRVCMERSCRLAERRRKERQRKGPVAPTACEFCKVPLSARKKRCCGDPACRRAMHESLGRKDIQAPSHEDRVAAAFKGLSFTDDPRAVRPEIRFTKLPELRHSPSGNGTAMCASARRT